MVSYRYLSVCAGIEAFTVAVQTLDFEMAAVAEIEAFPCAVLHHHYGVGRPEHVPAEMAKAVAKIPVHTGDGPRNLGDMTLIDPTTLGRIDWLVGGTPCQSFSIAGLRLGLDDDRGNLSLEYVRLAHELADGNGLRGLLWENVPGCLSDAGNFFGCFVAALIGHDAPLLPGDKPRYGKSNKFWRWINAREKEPIYDDEGQATGEFTIAAEGYHRPGWPSVGMASGPRARVAWRVLDSRHFGVAQRRRRVFLVADFGNGPDPAAVLFEPRGQGWRVAAGGQAGEEVAGTLANRVGGGGRLGTDMELGGGLQVAHSLSAEGADASDDGTGRGTPLVVVDLAPTMRAGGNKTGGDRPPGSDVDTVETLVIYEGNAEGGNAELPSINASNGKKGINNQTPLISVFDPNQITSKANRSTPEPEMAHTMPATGNAPVLFSITPSNSNEDYRANEKDISQAVTGSSGSAPSARGGDIVVHAIQERATSTNPDSGPDGVGVQADIAYTMEARSTVQAVAFNPQAGGKQTSLGESDIPGALGTTQKPAIAFNYQMGSKAGGIGDADEESPTMGGNPNIAVALALRGREGGNMAELGGEHANALRGADGGSSAPMAIAGPQVRRLVPEECEKLQGFPVGYTRIPGLYGWRDVGPDEDVDELRAMGHEVRTNKKTGKSRVNDPDGPRYKSLGNSFTVEPVNFIMSRVQASLRGEPMPGWQPMQLWRKPAE